jgi:hypothetical protein
LLEARDERRLLKLQRDLASVKLLIIDELGYVPLSPTGAELLFETFSQRYERGSTIVTSNLPFEDWTSVLGSERLTGALLDRLTHHVSILAMNGDSYRLKESTGRRRPSRGGPKPGHRRRPRYGRNYPSLTPIAEAALQKGPRSGAFLQTTPPRHEWPAFTPPRWPGI